MSKRHLIAALAAFVTRLFPGLFPGLFLGLLLGLLPAGPAAAQAIERISDHKDWSAFRY